MGQDVEQHFRVALGVDVAVVHREQLTLKGVGIGQISVMHQHNSKRRIHVKGLSFLFAVRVACGGVTHLA